jgi:predicted acetyltransferase
MEFRTITEGEIEPFFLTLHNAFGEAHVDPEEFAADMELLERDRTFAAFDGGAIVGCAALFSQQMVVPGGGLVPTAGVTLVGVLPTHRRRGILRALMTQMLDQAVDRGEALSTLFASQATIYGRFGFAHAAGHLGVDVALDRVTWGTEPPPGRVVLCAREEALSSMFAIYDRAVRRRAGGVVLSEAAFTTTFREPEKREDKPFYAIHEDADGTPDGFAMYRMKHEWPRGLPHVELKVNRLVAATPDGEEALWRYLFDVDLVSKVKADSRPVDEPLLLALEEPRALRPELDDGLFLRPLDIVAALEARSYAGDGMVTLEVADAFRPAVAGTYELVAEHGRGTCRRIDGPADVACSVHAVGACYLGGSSWSAMAAARRVDERTQGAIVTLDRMCATALAPWAITFF